MLCGFSYGEEEVIKWGKFPKSYTPPTSISLLEELIMCITNPLLRAVSGHFFLAFYHWMLHQHFFFSSAVISLSLVKTRLWLLWQTSLLSPNPDPSLHPSPMHTFHHPLTQGLVACGPLWPTEWGRSNVPSLGFKRPRTFPLAPLCVGQTLRRPGQTRRWQEQERAVEGSRPRQAHPHSAAQLRRHQRAMQPALKGRQAMLTVLLSECNWMQGDLLRNKRSLIQFCELLLWTRQASSWQLWEVLIISPTFYQFIYLFMHI